MCVSVQELVQGKKDCFLRGLVECFLLIKGQFNPVDMDDLFGDKAFAVFEEDSGKTEEKNEASQKPTPSTSER